MQDTQVAIDKTDHIPTLSEMGILDQTQKRDAGKPDPLMIEEDLIYPLRGILAVLEYGKRKYGARGGWKQVDMERYKSAAERHRMSRMEHGIEDTDEESGLLHIFHELCDLMFIAQDHVDKYAEPEGFFRFNEPPKVK